ncbi:MAG: ABC transporter ATP-binding protein [Acetobacteraceae bacterium]|nr:ABC transporter ATP-binding protein [Acetobacteraceae bacterium]
MIATDNLHIRFKAVHAVKGVTFAVGKGESFGLVGESGSGKSTVLRALAGLNRDYTGSITLDGAPLPPDRPKGFFRRVQMVFQDPYGSLHPRHTVDRCLSEPLAIHAIADTDRRIRKVLDEVALPERFRFRFPHQLSGGQRQRVAIARALILEPEVLLLDEPTSALDVSVQAEILNLLADLRGALGLTFLLVTHNLPVVAHLCDRVAVMEDGQIVELLATDAFREGRVSHPRTKALLEAAA